MDPYDSDSSVDEDFTETSVLLGYADEEVIEDTISHLGGWPVRFPTSSQDKIYPRA
jgi:pre-rRNA-processing protein TSR4